MAYPLGGGGIKATPRSRGRQSSGPASTYASILMAKTKNTNKGKKMVQGQKKKKGNAMARYTAGLDAAAVAWAKLLADPCSAPLTGPCYPTGSGGFLVRVESDLLYSYSATSVAGAMMFIPGMLQQVTGQVCSVQYIDSAADNTTVGWTAYTNGQPGIGPAAGNQWSSARPVAACAQLMWPGSELNRQGVVSMGVVPGAMYDNPANSVAQWRTACEKVFRMPDSICEVKWRPGEADNQFSAPSAVEPATLVDGKNALLITYSGLPVSTGVRIRLVAVYEVTPSAAFGTVVTMESPAAAPSKNSVNEILSTMDRAGNWAYSLASSPAANLAWDVGATLVKTAANFLML